MQGGMIKDMKVKFVVYRKFKWTLNFYVELQCNTTG